MLHLCLCWAVGSFLDFRIITEETFKIFGREVNGRKAKAHGLEEKKTTEGQPVLPEKRCNIFENNPLN